MTKFIIDTHVLIWHLTDADTLSKIAKKAIQNIDNQIFISIVSLWEIAIKTNIGKLNLNYSLQDIITEVKNIGFEILPIEPQNLYILEQLELHHRDPFDRLIIAQGISEDAIVITKDENFSLYPVQLLW